jgi:hypothetical protein
MGHCAVPWSAEVMIIEKVYGIEIKNYETKGKTLKRTPYTFTSYGLEKMGIPGGAILMNGENQKPSDSRHKGSPAGLRDRVLSIQIKGFGGA